MIYAKKTKGCIRWNNLHVTKKTGSTFAFLSLLSIRFVPALVCHLLIKSFHHGNVDSSILEKKKAFEYRRIAHNVFICIARLQETVDTAVFTPRLTRGRAFTKTGSLHMPATRHSSSLKPVNTQKCMQCIKHCICAHASVQSIQLFLSTQQ